MNRYESKEFKELVSIQNQMTQTDIITITGFMNDEQFLAHLEVQRERLNKSQNN